MASRLQDVLLRGLAADKPLATEVANGTLYYSTDTFITEQSDGSDWQTFNDGGGGPVPNGGGSFLQTGGIVTWVVDYDFNVSAASYSIQGTPYTSLEQSITLDAADPTNPRIDIIGLDNTGTVFKVTGTPAANPSEPDIDPGTQLKLSIVLVPALSTEPVITEEVLYFDNAGSPTEWDWTTSGAGFNVNSTNNPKSPSTKDIEGTTVTAGAYAQGEIGSGTVDPNDFNNLILYIRSKAAWANNRGLAITLRLAGVQIGIAVNINRIGTFGFDSSITSDYQLVAIPITLFAVTEGTEIDQIRITAFGSNHGFYIDDIKFQGGDIDQTLSGITQAQADARYAPLIHATRHSSGGADPVSVLNLAGYPGGTTLFLRADNTFAVPSRTAVVGIIVDGNGSVITTGVKDFIQIPFACTIIGWTLLSSDPAVLTGDVVIDIWKDTYANYPPTDADSITAAAPPTISAGTKATDSTLTGWTVAISAGDVLGFNVDSVATLERVTLELQLRIP